MPAGNPAGYLSAMFPPPGGGGWTLPGGGGLTPATPTWSAGLPSRRVPINGMTFDGSLPGKTVRNGGATLGPILDNPSGGYGGYGPPGGGNVWFNGQHPGQPSGQGPILEMPTARRPGGGGGQAPRQQPAAGGGGGFNPRAILAAMALAERYNPSSYQGFNLAQLQALRDAAGGQASTVIQRVIDGLSGGGGRAPALPAQGAPNESGRLIYGRPRNPDAAFSQGSPFGFPSSILEALQRLSFQDIQDRFGAGLF